MAKQSKKTKRVNEEKITPIKTSDFTLASLVAVIPDTVIAAEIETKFTSGLGQITAILFRNGVLINMQSISSSGKIVFSDVQSRDSLAINGICTGKAEVSINIDTIPETPKEFNNEIIATGFIIL